MIVRLEHNNLTVYEVRSEELREEIVVGRSHECAWRVPDDDRLCSGRHAAIARRRRAVWVRDLESKNGIFFRGKRVAKRKLRAGDRVSIGDCVLCAEAPRGGDGAQARSALVVMTGRTRGMRKDIEPPRFTIGSDPGCSLCIPDMLVSRQHAEILAKADDSCWVRDLGSRNGTLVNDVPLSKETERLLKDGDKLSIAHLELVFHDGAVKHSNAQVWLRLGIVACTAAIAIGGYATWLHMRPSAEQLAAAARAQASQAEFAAARETLAGAADARGYRKAELEIVNLKRSVTIWEATWTTWRDARANLAASAWTSASRDLGRLQAARREDWSWNDDAVLEKAAALQAKILLDALLRAEGDLARPDVSVARLREDAAGLASGLASAASDAPEHLRPLLDALRATQDVLAVAIQDASELEGALDRLQEPSPDLAAALAIVERSLTAENAFVNRRAHAVAAAVRDLAAAHGNLLAIAGRIRELDFAGAAAQDPAIPPVEACAVDARVSAARTYLEGVHRSLVQTAHQLAFLDRKIVQALGGDTAPVPAVVQLWGDAALLEAVLRCDTLDHSIPRRSRTEPAGAFDRMLGVDSFYPYLSSLPEAFDAAIVADLPFAPVVERAFELLRAIEQFKAYLAEPQNAWLVYGKLARTLERYERVLGERDRLVQNLLNRARTPRSRREAILAAGIADSLALRRPGLRMGTTELRVWIADELKKLRAELLERNTEFAAASPARQIEVRTAILAQGIPGDPIVRRMWAQRDSTSP
jgi:pSer/pThr/pTyr-binding forkhead associated (FHA) protein